MDDERQTGSSAALDRSGETPRSATEPGASTERGGLAYPGRQLQYGGHDYILVQPAADRRKGWLAIRSRDDSIWRFPERVLRAAIGAEARRSKRKAEGS